MKITLCECSHRFYDHELVDHGAVSEHTRILVREKCTKCDCKMWKASFRQPKDKEGDPQHG